MQQPTLPLGRGIAALAGACAVLTVAACSAAGAVTTSTATTNTAVVANASGRTVTGPAAVSAPAVRSTGPGTIAGCKVGAWAEKVSDAGRVAWQVSLPVDASLPYGAGESPAPLAIGGRSLFPDGDALYALRLTDGSTAWHRAFATAKNPGPGAVTGLWAWHGSVIVLLGADSAAPSLVSLNPATGAVRWRAGLGAVQLEFGTAWLTSDGVAMAATGTQGRTVTAIDLATGRRLWSRAYPHTPIPAVAGTTLVVEAKTSGTSPATLTGLRARTGATLWSRTGFPNWVSIMAAPGGRVLVDGINAVPPPPPRKATVYPVIALSAATGTTLWQLKTQEKVSALWPQGGGLVIASGEYGVTYVQDPGARLELADLATGRVRWSVPEAAEPYATTLIAPDGDVLSFATSPATVSVIDRAARTGATRWTAPISNVKVSNLFLAKPRGPNVLAAFPGASADKPSRLLAIDEATGKTKATDLLPYTAPLGSDFAGAPNAITVTGGDALLEPEQASCAVAVAPGGATAAHPGP